MKRLALAVLLCGMAGLALAQQDPYSTHALPQRMYDALLHTAQSAQTEADQAALRGVLVVEVGFASCVPCRMLLAALQDSSAGPSVLDQWQARGVGFYQLDWLKDKKQAVNVSSYWGIQSAPVLLVFKNGQQIARLNGWKKADEEANVARLLQLTQSH